MYSKISLWKSRYECGSVELISYEQLMKTNTDKIDGERGIHWGLGKNGEEERRVRKESVLFSLTPLSSSDFSFSDKETVKVTDGRITKIEHESGIETCIMKKELKKVNYLITLLIKLFYF